MARTDLQPFDFFGIAKARLLWPGLFLALILSCLRASAEDWPKFGKDLANTAHSNETGINSRNVNSLQTKWTFMTGGIISTTPAVVTIHQTRVLFVGAWNGVFYALNAVTGKVIWSFTVDYVGGRCVQATPWCRIGSSPAVDVTNNMVFFGSYNGYLYALRASTGKLVWKQLVGGSRAGYEVWSSPAVYNGMVFVGVSSHGDMPCLPGGAVNAYNELSGEPIWSFNTIDQSTCPGGGICVGGSVWSSVAIDDANGIVYAGTGNPGSTCTPPTQNAGLYPDSILALNASTGKLLNYFQAVTNDINDLDFGASPVLHQTGETNQCTGSTTTQSWVSEGSKDGYIYTVERDINGLTTNEQQKFSSNSGFVATAAVRPWTTTKSCDSNGHNILDSGNTLYDPGSSGVFWLFQQDHTGNVVFLRKDTLATKNMAGAPASIADVVLFGSPDGNFYASDKNGVILKTIPAGAAMYGGVSISNSRIYFGTTDGTLYCISPNGQ